MAYKKGSKLIGSGPHAHPYTNERTGKTERAYHGGSVRARKSMKGLHDMAGPKDRRGDHEGEQMPDFGHQMPPKGGTPGAGIRMMVERLNRKNTKPNSTPNPKDRNSK